MRRILILVLTLSWLTLGAAGQAKAEQIFVVTNTNSIFSFDSATPGTISTPIPITGLGLFEQFAGIDFRPATGQLYGVATSGRLYTINTATGGVTLVPFDRAPQTIGPAAGVDFNPVADRLRVVGYSTNRRIDVDAGVFTIDRSPNYAPGDPNFGQPPGVVGSAYTNNFVGSTSTTLFGIDTNRGVLVIQDPPNDGTLTTVGPLGGNFPLFLASVNLDISGITGTAYASVFVPGDASRLYTINLSTGAATFVGRIGGDMLITGLAAPVGTVATIPEPATILLLSTGLAGVGGAAHRRRKAHRANAS